MKKKNGFTLIELLAIIVILAIIAVITVPIILEIIENSKVGAVTDSAYGYKDAINKWYVSKLQEDSNYTLNGDYIIEDGKLNNIEIPLSGDKPENGKLHYTNNILDSGCLTIGEYAITFEDGKVATTEKGKCSETQYLYISKEIAIYPDMYLGIWDNNENNFIKTNDKLQLSDGTMSKPTDKKVYLRYTLNNGQLPNEAIPEVCAYTESEGELCLRYNEYEISADKIKKYFKFNKDTWIKEYEEYDDSSWFDSENPTKRCGEAATSGINDVGLACNNSNIRIWAVSSEVMADNLSADFSCGVSIESIGFSSCLNTDMGANIPPSGDPDNYTK